MNKQCIVFVLLASTFFFILESLSADPSVIGTKKKIKCLKTVRSIHHYARLLLKITIKKRCILLLQVFQTIVIRPDLPGGFEVGML